MSRRPGCRQVRDEPLTNANGVPRHTSVDRCAGVMERGGNVRKGVDTGQNGPGTTLLNVVLLGGEGLKTVGFCTGLLSGCSFLVSLKFFRKEQLDTA